METSLEALSVLLKHDAHVNSTDAHGTTALMMAAKNAGKYKAAEVLDSLLRAGADEAIVDDKGLHGGGYDRGRHPRRVRPCR